MAKGAMRPNKETRKPKKDAKAKAGGAGASKEPPPPVIAIRAKKDK